MESAAALVAVLTALGGLALAAFWMKGGGISRPAPDAVRPGDVDPDRPDRARLSGVRIAVHAILGIVVTILLVSAAVGAHDWHGKLLVGLLLVAALGTAMVVPWVRDRRAHQFRRPDQNMPVLVVLAYGVAAAATIALTIARIAT